jgi:asparagine synthase (glutamine-hydrolysing)
MCGIAGCWDFDRRQSREDLCATVAAMTRTLAHRGPDGEGVWLDEPAGLALGQRRLAIVGSTENGKQPMHSLDGRYTLVVNGELYNFHELRECLRREGHSIRGDCDSEVLLESFAAWGVARALSQAEGMFAFALWDGLERTLHLGRDRIGEKPLYYGWLGSSFVFGSELKAMRMHSEFSDELDGDALARYLRYGYVGGSDSIYKSIRKLGPGMRIEVRGPNVVTPKAYWDLSELVQSVEANPFTGDPNQAVDQLDHLLMDAIRMRLRTDVPVGVFLSGGVDSSTILSMVSQQIGKPVQSFSIGMCDEELDELAAARAIGRHLGSEHHEAILDDAAGMALIPSLPGIFDEPFGDASAIPALFVAKLAQPSLKTVMGGDGGDEILSGYGRYRSAMKMWQQTKWLPAPMRIFAGDLLIGLGGARTRAVGSLLAGNYPQSIHWHLVSHWKDPGPLCSDLASHWKLSHPELAGSKAVDFQRNLLLLDMQSLLPGDLLVKVDRTSMAHGIEVRLPFLAPQVVEFCLGLPANLRLRNGQAKWVLHQVLRKYLPDALIGNRKKGFAVPLARWLRGPLRHWCEELLSEKRLRESGVFAVDPIRFRWRSHLQGERDFSRALWNVLMFQAWDQTRRQA